jgi:transposase InsO family protein
LDRNFRVPRENRVRVSDITYIEAEQGRMYLTVIIDLFNGKAVGRSMGDDLGTEKTIVPALDGDWGQQKKNTFNIRL